MTVSPGEYIGSEEEYLPGQGVYAENSDLYAARTGETVFDPKNHVASLKSKGRVPVFQTVGTVTVGVVASVSETNAIVDLAPAKKDNVEYVVTWNSATLPVMNVSREYVEDLRNEVKVGDLVRVRIVERSKYNIRLAINEPNLGVIKGFCGVCRKPLVLKDGKLYCEECERTETRKMADDYGSGSL